ncbi:MAG: hypothetical protein WD512_13765 [Candidatus Paceibacterota bacterium]
MRNAFRDLLEFQKNNPQLTNNETLFDEFFKESDYLDATTWSKDDIRGHAENLEVELSEDEVNQVADLLVHGHDAEQGINWDVIASRIYEVKGE